MISLAEVRARALEVAAIRGDWELQNVEEETLLRDVLDAIADGHPDAAELARTVLGRTDKPVPRFSGADVELLRAAADWQATGYDNCDPAEAGPLRDLADRIAALLPPESLSSAGHRNDEARDKAADDDDQEA